MPAFKKRSCVQSNNRKKTRKDEASPDDELQPQGSEEPEAGPKYGSLHAASDHDDYDDDEDAAAAINRTTRHATRSQDLTTRSTTGSIPRVAHTPLTSTSEAGDQLDVVASSGSLTPLKALKQQLYQDLFKALHEDLRRDLRQDLRQGAQQQLQPRPDEHPGEAHQLEGRLGESTNTPHDDRFNVDVASRSGPSQTITSQPAGDQTEFPGSQSTTDAQVGIRRARS
ncbi:hypothetical protein Neosp_008975 [[Neocosmospora] mangrovei]